MAKTIKTAKAQVKLATLLTDLTINAFAYGQTSMKAELLGDTLAQIIKKIAEKDIKQASAVFTTAYIAGRMHTDAERLTDEMVAQVNAICDRAHYDESNAPTKDGRQRNTLAEKRLRDAARKAWERLSKAEAMGRADNRGGARQTKGNKTPAKTPSKTTIPLVAKTPKDAAQNIASLKQGWLHMVAGLKELELTAAEVHECNEVTIHLNRLELALGERAKASK